jgi:nucleoside-diphosphate-sugar epimerase
MRKILVFGANGYIGNAISRHLSQDGFDVTKVCRFGANYPKDTAKIIEFNNLSDCINEIDFKSFDIVISCIGLAHDRLKSAREDDIIFSNLTLPTIIFDRCIKANVGKFITISSAYVYHSAADGELVKLKDIDTLRIDLKIKALCEEQLLSMNIGNKGSLYILQLPQVYGNCAPGLFQKLKSVTKLSRFFPVPPPFIKRSLVNIINVTDFVNFISCSDIDYGGRLIVCDAEPYTWRDIANFIKLNQTKNVILIPIPAFILQILFYFGVRPALLQNFILSHLETEKCVGWKPKFTLFS